MRPLPGLHPFPRLRTGRRAAGPCRVHPSARGWSSDYFRLRPLRRAPGALTHTSLLEHLFSSLAGIQPTREWNYGSQGHSTCNFSLFFGHTCAPAATRAAAVTARRPRCLIRQGAVFRSGATGCTGSVHQPGREAKRTPVADRDEGRGRLTAGSVLGAEAGGPAGRRGLPGHQPLENRSSRILDKFTHCLRQQRRLTEKA